MNDSEHRGLQPAFSELTDTVSDLRSANVASLITVLRRLVSLLDRAPLADFIAVVLPPTDFDDWWTRMRTTGSAMAGSGSLDWPQERAARVAMQLALCRALADERVAFHELALHFLHVGTPNISAHVQRFVQVVVAPMVRDLLRLAETRPVPLPLSAPGGLPHSGDDVLDQLLREAMNSFRDPAPAARQQAAERLWDAWERLKSLDARG
jgi:hypothetical protein